VAIYLGVGSNLGARLANLRQALKNFSVLQQSSFYETEPVDFLEQPWFINAAVKIDTNLPPNDLLALCQDVENRLGRLRRIPKGPRVIDIDILFYDDVVSSDPFLTLPHPQISNRRFVLEPLNEIAPNLVHPVLRKTIYELLLECKDTSAVRKL
jgi:2-amino-4-hydroxy-6-hydroxymethyldihydropteridine diphosphokinase